MKLSRCSVNYKKLAQLSYIYCIDEFMNRIQLLVICILTNLYVRFPNQEQNGVRHTEKAVDLVVCSNETILYLIIRLMYTPFIVRTGADNLFLR